MTLRHEFDADGWLNITLEPETIKEATQLARLAMNQPANDDAPYIHADEEKITLSHTFRTLRSRWGEQGRPKFKTRIRTAK